MANKPASKSAKAKKKTCRRVRVKGSKKLKKVCTTSKKHSPKKKKKPATAAPTRPKVPTATPAAPPVTAPPVTAPPVITPPVTTPPAPIAPPPVDPPKAPGPPVYDGPFGVRQAERLLWRAGFGPGPGQAEALASMGLVDAVRSLTRPSGPANLVGAAPALPNGTPFAPYDAWGHDHLWWLDRMVRSDQPLVERMTLIWHDWFATSNRDVNDVRLMIAQNELFRSHALGSFGDLAREVTIDPAMLIALNGIENRTPVPNERYGRDFMELFTVGADRGAYTETDVRTLARAFTGWRADGTAGAYTNFRFDPTRADTGSKTLWAGRDYERTGNLGWQDGVTLCLENPYHRSFFVLKLWSYFVPSPPSADTQAALEALYESSGRSIGQVVEAILLHPDLHQGAPLVKPPAVYTAGLLRATGQTITTDAWVWLGDMAGQMLFYPPSDSGWNDRAWLDTSTLYGRWYTANQALLPAERTASHYTGSTETPEQALATALASLGQPALATETSGVLLSFAALPRPADADAAAYRALRQNALRQLIATSPDCQVS